MVDVVNNCYVFYCVYVFDVDDVFVVGGGDEDVCCGDFVF